jgi:DNA-binding beta-propeller fold protein YncE
MRRLVGITGSIVTALALMLATPLAASSAPEVGVTPVHVIKTFNWSPPSPDPTGLSYNKASGKLLVSDSEVDEIRRLWKGFNLFEAFRGGQLARTGKLTRKTHEPEDIAWDNAQRVLYVADDDKDAVFKFDPGRDGKIGTRDDAATEALNTHRFRSHDPEGLGYDAADKSLLVVDQRDAKVYHVRRGRDHKFGTTDDRVSGFKTGPLGLTSPEDVEFDPATNHLLIVSSTEHYIAETTVAGSLVRLINIAAASIDNASGIALAPGTNDPAQTNAYIADRGFDNKIHPRENDGRIVEVDLP